MSDCPHTEISEFMKISTSITNCDKVGLKTRPWNAGSAWLTWQGPTLWGSDLAVCIKDH